MHIVKKVPREANVNIARKRRGIIEKRMKEKQVRSIMEVIVVWNRERLNSVKLRMSSAIR